MNEPLRRGRPRALSIRDRFEIRQNVEAGVTIKDAAAMAGVSPATAMRALAELRDKLGPERRKNERRARAYLYLPREEESESPSVKSEGYVYVFAAGEHVKIGTSQFDVDTRWWQIKSSNPLLEPPLYISPPVGASARELEGMAHKALGQYRCSGEWFKCSRDLAIATVKSLVERALDGHNARSDLQHRSLESI